MDVPKYRSRKCGLVFGIIIINGPISKRGGLWCQYMDLIKLRSNMDRTNRTRNWKLVFNIIILYGTISKCVSY